MTVFNMHHAKTNLSELVARAESGEEIVIARRNRPVVKLTPLTAADISDAGRPAQPVSSPDPLLHAPADEISKEDVAAHSQNDANEGAEYDVDGLAAAMRAGREFPILRDGKVVAKVVPVAREPRKPGRFAHLSGNLPSDVFDHPLSETELQSWEGKHSFDEGK